MNKEEIKRAYDTGYVKGYKLAEKKYKEVFDKAIEYINENWGHWCSNHCKYATETIEILKGSGINEYN